jgi:DNA repair ATPase RecN
VSRGLILFAFLVVLVALDGCGSGSSTVSKEEFAQELKLVCNKGLQEQEKLIRDLTQEYYEQREERATPEYQAENLRKVVDAYQNTTSKIAEIDLPEGEEEKVEDMIRAREEAAAKIEASPLGTRDNVEIIFRDADAQAKALDAPTCVL